MSSALIVCVLYAAHVSIKTITVYNSINKISLTKLDYCNSIDYGSSMLYYHSL